MTGLHAARPVLPSSPRRCRPTSVAVGLLATQAALLAWGSTRHAPAWDEVGHLPAGVSHWRSGRFDAYRVNPPLARVAATWPAALAGADVNWDQYRPEPWHRTEFDLGHYFIVRYGPDSLWYLTAARWACVPFAALGGWVCFAWARRLSGAPAGLAAVTLWAFSPNVLAHAQLVTPDAAAAALGTLACFAFWAWLGRPTWPRAAGAGAALGLALLTKFTFLLFGPVWLALWACHAARRRGRTAAQLVAAFLLSVYVVNVGYAFEDSFRPLGEFQFVSRPLAGYPTGRGSEPWFGNRFAGTWFGRVPVPVPANYLMGIDVQRRDFELGMNSYLRGEWRKGGWWHYYLYALLVKESVGTLCLVGLALGTVLLRRPAVRFAGDLVPLACGVAVIAFVSSQTGFNHHLRYVLPALPLLYIFAAQVFAPGRSRWVYAVGWACVVGAAASSLYRYPHSLSYFNELAGGPRAGPRHLHNSNLDWGQDLLYLKRWCDEYPDRRPLYVVYSGGFDAASLGFWDGNVHHAHDGATRRALLEGTPGPAWYALFVGRFFDPPDEPDLFARFRGREPDERVADTIYIFRDEGAKPGGR